MKTFLRSTEYRYHCEVASQGTLVNPRALVKLCLDESRDLSYSYESVLVWLSISPLSPVICNSGDAPRLSMSLPQLLELELCCHHLELKGISTAILSSLPGASQLQTECSICSHVWGKKKSFSLEASWFFKSCLTVEWGLVSKLQNVIYMVGSNESLNRLLILFTSHSYPLWFMKQYISNPGLTSVRA